MAADRTDTPEGLSAAPVPLSTRQQGLNLFLVGFLVLFWELACIRWFAANVIFLQFFTNVVLLAAFLGMSCGCLAARRREDWLARLPWLALLTVVAALGTLLLYERWSGLAVDVGNQASPQQVFFGTEYRNPDVARFVIPIELIAATFFVLIALMFVGLGQVLGRAFDAYPDRIAGYTLNIGGSLAGIAGFSALSFTQAPPLAWFLIGSVGVAYLLSQGGRLTWTRGIALAALVALVAVPVARLTSDGPVETRWSPYYQILHHPAERAINVNTIGHQTMVPFAEGGSSYSLIHLLRQHSGGKPFEDVLIIGAGSGNDMAHALRFGATRIDAVEIDPVIQDIGVGNHPDRPYQDPRVVRHLDDGRHFLRTTERKYDLVVYALVDSLILHSSYANVRLESFLFTEQAFADIGRVLKPGGVFVSYNYLRQGWIVERVAAMMRTVFGTEPLVMSLPHQEAIRPADPVGFVMLAAGDNQGMAEAFRREGPFWMNTVPPRNLGVSGFAVEPDSLPEAERGQWERVAPAALVRAEGSPLLATDDWPFIYLRDRLIPDLSVRSMLMLGALGVAMVVLFMPKGGRIGFNARMFFLGAAFMLLETKAVVHMALLFGSTWLVNSAVFFTVLLLILLANLYVLKAGTIRLPWAYAGLFALLAANVLVPFEVFLGGGVLWRYVAPCALSLGPVLFAGAIFAQTFREAPDPDQAFGSNIAGSVVGGLAESFSMLLGFRHLLLLAILFYALSAFAPSLRLGRGTVPGTAAT